MSIPPPIHSIQSIPYHTIHSVHTSAIHSIHPSIHPSIAMRNDFLNPQFY
jgi:hypothetical protein